MEVGKEGWSCTRCMHRSLVSWYALRKSHCLVITDSLRALGRPLKNALMLPADGTRHRPILRSLVTREREPTTQESNVRHRSGKLFYIGQLKAPQKIRPSEKHTRETSTNKEDERTRYEELDDGSSLG